MTQISYPPPRASHGCLWGCLGVAALVLLPILVTVGYGAWFLYDGFHRDPAVRAAQAFLDRDGLAHQAMGANIAITGVAGNFFAFHAGAGARSAYVLKVEGGKGEGRLAVESHATAGHVTLDSLLLTGPDGRRYDLLGHAVLPGEGPPRRDDTI